MNATRLRTSGSEPGKGPEPFCSFSGRQLAGKLRFRSSRSFFGWIWISTPS